MTHDVETKNTRKYHSS